VRSEGFQTGFGVKARALLHDELLDRSGEDELVFRKPICVGFLRSRTFAGRGLHVIRFALGTLYEEQSLSLSYDQPAGSERRTYLGHVGNCGLKSQRRSVLDGATSLDSHKTDSQYDRALKVVIYISSMTLAHYIG